MHQNRVLKIVFLSIVVALSLMLFAYATYVTTRSKPAVTTSTTTGTAASTTTQILPDNTNTSNSTATTPVKATDIGVPVTPAATTSTATSGAIQTPTTGTINNFKSCSINTEWACRPATQGAEYNQDNPPAEVCGCMITKCPAGEIRIINALPGVWPDGTNKGTSVCSSDWPPSAAE